MRDLNSGQIMQPEYDRPVRIEDLHDLCQMRLVIALFLKLMEHSSAVMG